MIRKLQVLGLAVVAVFAMSALGASAAQAQNTELTPEGGAAATLDGEQVAGTKHNFAVGSREFTCEKAKFSGSIAGNTTTVKVTPNYEECMTKPVLGITFPVTVTMNSCYYEFHGTPTNGGKYETHVTIACTSPGDRIEVDVYKVGSKHETANHVCTLTIAPQTAGGTNQIDNNEASSPDDIVLTTNATVNVTIHGATCGGKVNTEEEFGATYTGETTIEATQGGKKVRLTVSHK